MEFLSRFKKKALEPVPDLPEVGLKKWQDSEVLLTGLEKTGYKLTSHTIVKLDSGEEIEYPPGTQLVINPPRDSGPEDSRVHYPIEAKVFCAAVERNEEGLLAPTRKLLYHFAPGSQQLFDYTDPEVSRGKTIADTSSESFRYVSELIKSRYQGEQRS